MSDHAGCSEDDGVEEASKQAPSRNMDINSPSAPTTTRKRTYVHTDGTAVFLMFRILKTLDVGVESQGRLVQTDT